MNEKLFSAIRKLNGLSQYQFADELGFSRSMIAKIEVYERSLTPDIVAKVNDVFGRDYVDMVRVLSEMGRVKT